MKLMSIDVTYIAGGNGKVGLEQKTPTEAIESLAQVCDPTAFKPIALLDLNKVLVTMVKRAVSDTVPTRIVWQGNFPLTPRLIKRLNA